MTSEEREELRETLMVARRALQIAVTHEDGLDGSVAGGIMARLESAAARLAAPAPAAPRAEALVDATRKLEIAAGSTLRGEVVAVYLQREQCEALLAALSPSAPPQEAGEREAESLDVLISVLEQVAHAMREPMTLADARKARDTEIINRLHELRTQRTRLYQAERLMEHPTERLIDRGRVR